MLAPKAVSIGMKTFGASAPLKELQKKFGFEPEQVVAAPKNYWPRVFKLAVDDVRWRICSINCILSDLDNAVALANE